MNDDEKNTFLRLNMKFGRREASCLSVALHRGAVILTDDLDARRFAQMGDIPVSGTIGILVKCIVSSRLSLEQGNELLAKMIRRGFYSPVDTLDRFVHDI